MLYEGKIWLGTGEHPVCLLPQMANRHGLIAGATGTGKTVSLKVLAEGFSDMGVPVFLADIKGDLAGMVQPGTHSDNIANRLTQCGVPTFEYRTFPTVFWDVFGKEGHPVRTTVSEMGPTLLARLMNLNDTQAGVLSILFRVADDENMLLLDLKDLKAMLAYVGEHAKEYTLDYGNVSMASVGAIQRAVAMLEDEGGSAELQRSNLAEKFRCVPSQINYVISTRFSPEHGYLVESRRGGNGYIRITRVQATPKALIMHTVNAVGDAISPRTAAAFVSNLLDADAVDERTATLILTAVSDNALRPIAPEHRDIVRASIFKQLLVAVLADTDGDA